MNDKWFISAPAKTVCEAVHMKLGKRKRSTRKIKERENCGCSPAQRQAAHVTRLPQLTTRADSSAPATPLVQDPLAIVIRCIPSYIRTENSSDSTTWGVRLYARDNTHALGSWADSTGCFVIPFSQLSANLSGPLSPNLSPGGAPRPMLSLKMDTKKKKKKQ